MIDYNHLKNLCLEGKPLMEAALDDFLSFLMALPETGLTGNSKPGLTDSGVLQKSCPHIGLV